MIIAKKYPEADPSQCVRFKHHDQTGVEPTFLRRFAALCRDHGVVGVIAAGYRTIQAQKDTAAYILKTTPGAIQRHNGAVYDKQGRCIVAAPGASNHNYRLAVDCESAEIKALPNSVFEKYGLRRPMPHEPWHIEPIETLGMSLAEKAKILNGYKEDLVMDVKGFQQALGLTPDGIVGPKTKAMAKEVLSVIQQILGLPDMQSLEAENAQLKNDIRVAKNALSKW